MPVRAEARPRATMRLRQMLHNCRAVSGSATGSNRPSRIDPDRRLQQPDHLLDERRLPRAVRAQQPEDLPVLHCDVDAVVGADTGALAFTRIPDTKPGCGSRSPLTFTGVIVENGRDDTLHAGTPEMACSMRAISASGSSTSRTRRP